MANPNFPSDGQGERIDALVDAAGVVYLKAGLAVFTPTGATDPAAAHLVGTHKDAATAGSTDPLALIGGLSGTTVKHVVVDANGHLMVVAKDDVASGAPTVPPFLTAGYDGANIQYLTVGTDGRLQVVGQVTPGAAVSGAGAPVMMGGQDGTNVRIPRTDANSYWQEVRGGYTDGSSTFFPSRIANIFKTAVASASGDTTVWTPTTGKKFRIMAYSFSVAPNIITSGGGVVTVKFRDATTDTNMSWEFYAPSSAVTTAAGLISTPWVTLGDGGYLSATANNVLHVNLSVATTGNVKVNVIGTEE